MSAKEFQWISVSSELPGSEDQVLVYGEHCGFDLAYFALPDKWFLQGGEFLAGSGQTGSAGVSHWMYLNPPA